MQKTICIGQHPKTAERIEKSLLANEFESAAIQRSMRLPRPIF